MAVGTLEQSSPGKSFDHSDFWAEFERRRRADRARRQHGGSEVQRLLAAVKQERSTYLDSSVSTDVSDAAPLGSSAEFPVSGASPQKISEIQQLLVEVQREREAAKSELRGTQKTLSLAPGSRSKPSARGSKLSGTRPAARTPASKKAETSPPHKDQASPAASELTTAADSSAVSPTQDGGSSVQSTSESQAVNATSGSSAAAAPKSFLAESMRSSSALPRARTCCSPLRRSPSSPRQRSQEPRAGSASSASRLRARSLSAQRAEAKETKLEERPDKYMGYPNGGWDDRTSCPISFDGFHGKPHPGRLESPIPCAPSPRSRFHSTPWNDRIVCPVSFDGFLDHLGNGPRKSRAVQCQNSSPGAKSAP
mmetsp:Transcript_64799/g.118356  ORF Transcript_64799/g.118356 Transcript_64799/m.118356 type:complete len:367 (-) Transcript_64799:17-1117(-)